MRRRLARRPPGGFRPLRRAVDPADRGRDGAAPDRGPVRDIPARLVAGWPRADLPILSRRQFSSVVGIGRRIESAPADPRAVRPPRATLFAGRRARRVFVGSGRRLRRPYPRPGVRRDHFGPDRPGRRVRTGLGARRPKPRPHHRQDPDRRRRLGHGGKPHDRPDQGLVRPQHRRPAQQPRLHPRRPRGLLHRDRRRQGRVALRRRTSDRRRRGRLSLPRLVVGVRRVHPHRRRPDQAPKPWRRAGARDRLYRRRLGRDAAISQEKPRFRVPHAQAGGRDRRAGLVAGRRQRGLPRSQRHLPAALRRTGGAAGP